MMRIYILFLCLFIAGCLSTEDTKSTFPTLSDPPKTEDYVIGTERSTVEHYHAILTVYHVYLGEYLNFIAKQYKLSHTPDPKPCLMVLKQNKIILSNLPEVGGYSDDRVLDVLIDHLSTVLKEIKAYNIEVDKHNDKIDKMCSGL